MKKTSGKTTCNMCGKQLNYEIGIYNFGVCDNPECPNFSLLQICEEEMVGLAKVKERDEN